MPCPLEDPPTHFRPGDRQHFSRIEFRHTALDLARPRGLALFHFAVKAWINAAASAARASLGSAKTSLRISAASRFMPEL